MPNKRLIKRNLSWLINNDKEIVISCYENIFILWKDNLISQRKKNTQSWNCIKYECDDSHVYFQMCFLYCRLLFLYHQ